MTTIQRGSLYIRRSKKKTVLMFGIFLLISVLCFLCTVIAKEANLSVEKIRESIGGEFYIRPTQKSMVDEGGNISTETVDATISKETIKEILDESKVRYWNTVNYGYAKSEQLRFVPGQDDNEGNNMGRIRSMNYSELDENFLDGTYVMLDGEHIVAGDSRKVPITDQLAETNGLKVGDRIWLKSSKLQEKDGSYYDGLTGNRASVEVEVKGIYSTTEENIMNLPTAAMPENSVIATFDILDELGQSEPGIYKGEQRFFVKDPKEIPAIEKKIRAIPGIDWEKYFIYSNDYKYSKVSEGMEEMETLMELLRIIVYCVGIIILFLVLIVNIRNRKKEAGIYLSIGISKRMIVVQYLLEVTLTFLAAFVIAIIVIQGMSGVVADRLFVEVPEKLISVENLNVNGVDGTGGLPAVDIVMWLGLEIAGLYSAVILAAIPILKLQPKTILSQME